MSKKKKKGGLPLSYRGFMVDEAELSRALADHGISLPELPEGWTAISDLHVTTSFQKEAKCTDKDVGAESALIVTGYAFNSKKGLALEVFDVETSSVMAKLEFKATRKLRPTHITVATAPGTKPAEMGPMIADGDCERVVFDEPLRVAAKYGGKSNVDGRVVTSRFDLLTYVNPPVSFQRTGRIEDALHRIDNHDDGGGNGSPPPPAELSF